MRWLIDAQLPPALARWLTAEGHDARHVIDMGLAEATDADIWQHAVDTAAVIVTKDEDFALRGMRRRRPFSMSGAGGGDGGLRRRTSFSAPCYAR